jgi:uncharacterized protein YqfB (UPF0267 family)
MWAMSVRGVELMARKYVKTITIRDTSEYEESEVDDIINKWINEKQDQVGTTIARFEILDINLTHVAETKNTVAYILALLVYTEMRL